jgi:hypothetical protein
MATSRSEHIVCYDGTRGDLAYAMHCLGCGQIQRVATPVSVPVYLAAAKAFVREHRCCRGRGRAARHAGSEPAAEGIRPAQPAAEFLFTMGVGDREEDEQ